MTSSSKGRAVSRHGVRLRSELGSGGRLRCPPWGSSAPACGCSACSNASGKQASEAPPAGAQQYMPPATASPERSATRSAAHPSPSHLASPKSQSLRVPWLVYSRLESLRSRCTTQRLCRYATPSSSCRSDGAAGQEDASGGWLRSRLWQDAPRAPMAEQCSVSTDRTSASTSCRLHRSRGQLATHLQQQPLHLRLGEGLGHGVHEAGQVVVAVLKHQEHAAAAAQSSRGSVSWLTGAGGCRWALRQTGQLMRMQAVIKACQAPLRTCLAWSP